MRAPRENASVLRYELSGGVHLRLFEEEDAEDLDQVIEANRAYLGEWLPWVHATGGVEDRRTYIRRTRRQLADNDGFQTAIVEGGRIIGSVGFHGVSWAHRSTSIGYWLAEDRQGRGIMTEAVRALVEHAFDLWRLHRIEIEVAVGNERSAAIPRRLGFREEGIRRQAERHGEAFEDVRVFGLVADEWRGAG